MQRVLVPAMFALAVLAGPAVALVARPPADGGPFLVIAAHPDATIVRAGGTRLSPLGAPLGALAASGDPGFARRLREGGAWLVLDGRVLAAICGVVS